jgi:uncharacterized protein YceK
MKLLIFVLAGCLTLASGCSSLRAKLGGKPGAEEPVASHAPSVLDSLWRAGLPVDTVILTERSREDYLPTDNRAVFRRGPSSVELGMPAKIRGYRVQLASSDSRQDLEALLPRVEREFSTTAYLEEQDGRYALRIGSFIRLEQAQAERDRAVSYGYKHAWIVQTDISFHEIQHKE